MIRRLFFIFLLFLAAFTVTAQPFGNEWINYSQTYLKIPVGQDGMYRIDYADLVAEGVPVAAIDPRRFQIFHRGQEQAIFVQGEIDGSFDTGDFIVFYGQRNDGTLDRRLYVPETAQPHQYYNLYSDTTAYFLTWRFSGPNGRRMGFFEELNTGGLSAELAETKIIREVYDNEYSAGRTFLDYTQYSQFDIGEGWTGVRFQENQFIDYTIEGIINTVPGAGSPQLSVFLQGRDDLPHRAEIFVGPNSGSLRSLGTIDFQDYNNAIFEQALLYTDISSGGDLFVRVSALGPGPTGNDLMSVSYIEVEYPKVINQNSEQEYRIRLDENPGNKSYVEVPNVPAGTVIFDVTAPGDVLRIGYQLDGATAEFIVPGTAVHHEIRMNSTYLEAILEQVDFDQYDNSAADFIIITHPLLRESAGGFPDAVQAYADYRTSPEGGGYTTMVADVTQLYDQFNYGEISSLAIYDFVRFLRANANPEYLFIIGEGMEIFFNYYRRRSSGTLNFPDLVPTAGFPASDVIYSSGMGSFSSIPTIPTGRLTARNPQQVINYLNKVRVTESLPFDALWRKKVLHLSGGISDSELSTFRNYMDGFARIAEDTLLGGNVVTIQKEDRSTLEFINIADEVNEGLNLVTFFGHSAPNIIDIDIGFVSNPTLGYNNLNRYPVFLINGCNAGQFLLNTEIYGEDWILTANRGAIGFIAHSSFGYSFDLREYTEFFYEVGYTNDSFYSQGLGDIQQEVSEQISNNGSFTVPEIAMNQQMFLLGDPAVNLFGAPEPDYAISNQDIFVSSFNNEPVTVLSDSFAINLMVRNFGKAIGDSVRVEMVRTLSNGNQIVYDSLFPAIFYSDTLQFTLRPQNLNESGVNSFLIRIDPNDDIIELNENNNVVSYNFNLQLNGTLNLFPYNYSLINDSVEQIYVQASDLLNGQREFLVELDTVPAFNSISLQSFTEASNVLLEVSPNWLNTPDTVTYFLRSRFTQPLPGEQDEFNTTSFTRIAGGGLGWGQRTTAQLAENRLEGLVFDDITGAFAFEKTVLPVGLRIIGSGNAASAVTETSLTIDGLEYNIDNFRRCRDNTINFIAFDRNSAVPYAPVILDIQDPRICYRQPFVVNSFRRNELLTGNEDDIPELISQISEGDSVIIFSVGNPEYSLWPAVAKTALEGLNISPTFWDGLTDGEPLVIKTRKGGAAATPQIFRTTEIPPEDQQLIVDTQITGIASSGTMTTGLIGPAESWGMLTLDIATETGDVYSVDIEGIDLEGNSSMIFTGINTSTNLESVNAETYPYLRLTFRAMDEIDLTPPTLRKWFITYQPVADGILLPPPSEQQNLQEGDSLNLSFAFYNYTPWNFSDSLQANYFLQNQISGNRISQDDRIPGPGSLDSTSVNITFPTRGLPGANDLSLSINPRLVPEEYYDNNSLLATSYLNVDEDNAAPLLDVRFDGQQIFNRDIVSPNPLISIVLRDDNEFLTRTDTTGIDVFLLRPCEGCSFERISLNGENIATYSDVERGEFGIEYAAGPLENGIHTLRVQADDVSGNEAGEGPYEIQFEVVNESTVTNFYPYPNPFSDNVRFVFTLTGSEIPDQMLIQILTVSGRVVKEITMEDFGMLRIGNNISEYAWDGRDDFGDLLANGVYLYKVILRSNGRNLDLRSTAGDDLFKNGYGKLYILR